MFVAKMMIPAQFCEELTRWQFKVYGVFLVNRGLVYLIGPSCRPRHISISFQIHDFNNNWAHATFGNLANENTIDMKTAE